MMIPKVIFRYSWFYDRNFKKIYTKEKDYPSYKNILIYIKKVQKLWERYEKEILGELSIITGLKWKEKIIICYVVGRCIPFSDPLTLPVIEKYPDYFIDNLVHESIHQLFTQNGNIERSKRAWNYINKKYKDKPFNTRIHIPLHAIHSHIYLKFFDEKRLRRDMKLIRFLPEYKKSWEIVHKESYKKIISEFRKRVKR